MIDIRKDRAAREIRWFAALWLPLMCLSLGAVPCLAAGKVAAAVMIWSLGAALTAACLANFRVARAVYLGLTYATFPIGYVVSFIILAAVFFLIVTPVGMILRWRGHDPMERRFDPLRASYWVARQDRRDVSSYFKQY